jgi:hypothetical protein
MKINDSIIRTSTKANSKIAPNVDSVVAISGESILWRMELRAWLWYWRHSLSMQPPVTANENVSIAALKKAWSSSPFRKTERKFWSTSSSKTLKIGSVACCALSGLLNVSFHRQCLGTREESYIDLIMPAALVTLQRAFGMHWTHL